MRHKQWRATPVDAAHFSLDAGALKKHWARLHGGDCEPFPTEDSLVDRLTQEGATTATEVTAGVQDAWRAFHRGDFQRAFELGCQLGVPGFVAALKAVGVHASAVETNEHEAQRFLLDASNRAQEILDRLPKDPNAHYMLAFTLGRYSQRISVVEAIARGFAGRIEHALTHTLKLEPKHADAHIALGLYHAEIISKLGSLTAGLTYGASSAKAIEHFRKAIKLHPDAPTAHLEYAHGLRLLDGEAHAAQIEKLLQLAAKCEPGDAMEYLDRERARTLLLH